MITIRTTTVATVADLLALVADADPSTPISFTKAKKNQPGPCWCGCDGTTKSRFVPGHDSRFHGLAKRVARGEADEQASLDALPHDEARTEFAKHVAHERPKAEAKAAAEAEEKARKEAAKAEAKAEREAAEAHHEEAHATVAA